MSLFYELAYLFGFTPWDRAGEPAPKLQEFLASSDAPKSGKALDLGCGLGRNALYLAERGFQVTGIDGVERALRVARKRAATRKLTVDFRRGDVTRLQSLGLDGPFDLLLDFGCFHAMSDAERARYSESLASVARPSAKLLMLAFGPKQRRGPGPRGVTSEDVERALSAAWQTIRSDRDEKMQRPASNAFAMWYLFSRK